MYDSTLKCVLYDTKHDLLSYLILKLDFILLFYYLLIIIILLFFIYFIIYYYLLNYIFSSFSPYTLSYKMYVILHNFFL